ncbi:MAG: S49 family peptidase [Mediterranea sp.]|jgi:ClpP class serine protease|nr:S49 family peptidase [Mediterranea sp.]
MIITSIDIELYLAEYLRRKFNNGADEPFRIPDNTDLYHTIWTLMIPRSKDHSPIDKGVPGAFFFMEDPPTYKEVSTKALSILKKSMEIHCKLEGINLTDDFSSDQLPEYSIAYHRIWGFITAASSWYFSSKQFEQDLLAAEANPAIACHFLHVNTPGGEAWYLDRLSETMRSLQKPVYVLVERCCASAGYYIACHSSHIYALTLNDQIGCIGSMVDFYEFSGYFEKLGIRHIIARADQSDLKNKKYNDLRSGKPEQYITDCLNPLTGQFISEVRQNRDLLAGLPEDDPVLRGETFDTLHFVSNGLIDGQASFIQAIIRAWQLGKEYADAEALKKRALSYV